jgi:ketosteroid isomerase-like protein
MRLSLVTLALFLAVFQLPAQTYTGPQEDIDQIQENTRKFSEYIVNADYDNIAASYTEDAKIFPRNVDIIDGQEKIKGYWILPEGVKTTHHKVTALEIKVIGDEAYDYGYYEGRSSRNGEESSRQGKYVIVWKKIDGNWKMYLDIWNSIR